MKKSVATRAGTLAAIMLLALSWVAHATAAPDRKLLTLEAAVAKARAQNPGLLAAALRAKAATARLDEAREGHLPELSLSSGLTLYEDPMRLIKPPSLGAASGFGDQLATVNIRLNQQLYTGGVVANTIRANEQISLSAGQVVSRFGDEVAFQVQATYEEILGRQAIVLAIRASREALVHYRQDVQNLIAARKAAKLDLIKVDVRLPAVRQQELKAQNDLQLARRHLVQLMGEANSAFPWRLAAPIVSGADTLELAAWQVFAQGNRADLQAAVATQKAKGFSVASLKGKRLPSLALQGGYASSWILNDQDPAAPVDEQIAQVGLLLNYKLPFGSGLEPRIRAASAEALAAAAGLESLRQKIQFEVESSYLNLQSAGERLNGTLEAENLAAEALRIQQEKYRLGKASSQDVLDAQAALLTAQTDHEQASLDVRIARAALRLAAGKELL